MKLDLKQGDHVYSRCSNGEMRENIVWSCDGRLVYVCSERQYAALRSGHPAPPPIGFLENDIRTTKGQEYAQ
jgi:hypothetical protein